MREGGHSSENLVEVREQHGVLWSEILAVEGFEPIFHMILIRIELNCREFAGREIDHECERDVVRAGRLRLLLTIIPDESTD